MLKKRRTPLDALFPEREAIRIYPIKNKKIKLCQTPTKQTQQGSESQQSY